MNTQAKKLPHLPLQGVVIAAIVVCGIVITCVAIMILGFDGAFAPATAPEAAAVPAAAAAASRARRCAECGVIESIREIKGPDESIGIDAPGRIAAASGGGIEATPLRIYEITIRSLDGTMRVIRDAKPAKWRQGERVSIIAGVD